MMLIPVPTITINPVGCAFTATWVVKRTSDNVDMVTTMSSVFSFALPDLVISHSISDYTSRKSLYGSTSYYFVATINDAASTKS